jgi:hypothetical protein
MGNIQNIPKPYKLKAGDRLLRTGRDSQGGAFLKGKTYLVERVSRDYMVIIAENGRAYEYAKDSKSFSPVLPHGHQHKSPPCKMFATGDTHIGNMQNMATAGMANKEAIFKMFGAPVQAGKSFLTGVDFAEAEKQIIAYYKQWGDVKKIHDSITIEVQKKRGCTGMKYNVEKSLTELKAAREVRLKAVQAIGSDVKTMVMNAWAKVTNENKVGKIRKPVDNAEELCVKPYDKAIKKLELAHEPFIEDHDMDVAGLIERAPVIDEFVKDYHITVG